MTKHHGKVAHRERFAGWDGKPVVRLDVRVDGAKGGSDVHVYVAEGHALAGLKTGDKLKLVTE